MPGLPINEPRALIQWILALAKWLSLQLPSASTTHTSGINRSGPVTRAVSVRMFDLKISMVFMDMNHVILV